MSLGHGSSIVRSGLVLHLDAANVKSYPGSGTAWNDLSGVGSNGTSVNGVGYNSANNGYLTFDGVDDYVNLGTNSAYNAISSITIELIFRRTSVGSGFYQVLLSNTRDCCGVYDGFQIQLSPSTSNPSAIQCNLWNSNNYANNDWNTTFTQMSIANSIGVDTWYHLVYTYDLQTSSFKGYINNVLRATITKANALSTNQASLNLFLGKSPSHNAPIAANVSACKIYNRALTAAEIRQNFEAFRGRYGI